METEIFNLFNGKSISTDDVKCPVCGKMMELECDSGEITSEHYISLNANSVAVTRIGSECTSRFRCPSDCCSVEFKHYVTI